jgi:TRAP-type uncharacterized transport system substrate-binding protein
MQRVAFRVGLVLLVTVGIGGLTFFVYRSYPWLFRAQYTIRMAVPPLTASGDKFVAALRREMAVEYPRVQLTFIQTPDLDASADALKSGHADAAMVRSDNPMAAEGRTLVIVRKIAAIVILGPHTDATGWSDLKEKKIGVLTTSGQLDPLQKVLLDFYDVSERDIRLLAPNDVGPEVAGKNVAAVLAIGPAGPGTIADAARAIRIATKQAPKFLDFDEADAIMQRYPAYEKLDIPQGAFVGSPPMPGATATAIAATVRLVSKPSLTNFAAGELTRVILAAKARLAASELGTGQIEAPDTDKSVFPIHPGTVSYLAGDKPDLVDDSLNYIALGSMVLGVFGTVGAWLAAMWGRRLHQELHRQVSALPSILAAIRAASPDELDRIEARLDQVSEWLVEYYVNEKIPNERYSAIEAKLAEIRTIIGRRRATFGNQKSAGLLPG